MARSTRSSGMTLLELVMAMSIVAILGVTCARVLAVAISSWNHTRHQSEAIQAACWTLEHILKRAGSSNRLLLPLRRIGTNPARDCLAFSAMVDTDLDGLIDEDPGADITNDGAPGILGIDDDGDGLIDETGRAGDDDEDAFRFLIWWYRLDSDWINGQNEDGDIYLDEDPPGDINRDGMPGVAGKDDDGDGLVDEGGSLKKNDDDEDGQEDEDYIEYWLYYLDPNGCLRERYYTDEETEVLAEGVTTFEVVRTERYDNISGVYLTLGITPPHGEEVILKTLVYFKGNQ